jgi:hypothetical protein
MPVAWMWSSSPRRPPPSARRRRRDWVPSCGSRQRSLQQKGARSRQRLAQHGVQAPGRAGGGRPASPLRSSVSTRVPRAAGRFGVLEPHGVAEHRSSRRSATRRTPGTPDMKSAADAPASTQRRVSSASGLPERSSSRRGSSRSAVKPAPASPYRIGTLRGRSMPRVRRTPARSARR